MIPQGASQSTRERKYSAFYSDLYARLFDKLIAVGLRVSADGALVEDSVHELFEYFMKDPEKLEGVENIEAYLSISLKRKLVKAVRRGRATVPIDNLKAQMSTPSPEVDMISSESHLLQVKRIRKAMTQLSPAEANAIQSRFYEGFSYEEIALANKSTKRTVYNQVHSAIQKLKGLL